MRVLYILATQVYSIVLKVAAMLGHNKALKIVQGRKITRQLKPSDFPPSPIWVHVASLGEYQQIKPILQYIKKYSTHPIVLSFYSSSGYDRVNDTHLYDNKIYLPADLDSTMYTLIDKVQAHALLLSRYDIWPIMIGHLYKRQTPVYLFSGHFREKQVYFQWYGRFFLDALRKISHLCVQDTSSYTLLSQYIDQDHLTIGGDLRVESILQDSTQVQKIENLEIYLKGKKCLIGASIYPEEVDMLLASWLDRGYKIILAPHDISPTNIDKIKQKLKKYRYSSFSDGIEPESPILILDTIGHLKSAYIYSTLAYVGGGFGKGIHNIVEPAIHHNRIIHGPKSSKFPESERLQELGSVYRITLKSELDHATDIMLEKSIEKIEEASKKYFLEQRELHKNTYAFLSNLDFIAS